LASLYVHFRQLAWIQGLFYGIGAAVSAIIVRSAWKLIQKTLGRDHLLWILFNALAVTMVWTQSEVVSAALSAGDFRRSLLRRTAKPLRAWSFMRQ